MVIENEEEMESFRQTKLAAFGQTSSIDNPAGQNGMQPIHSLNDLVAFTGTNARIEACLFSL